MIWNTTISFQLFIQTKIEMERSSILVIFTAVTLSCSPSYHCVDINDNEWDFKKPGLCTYIINGDTQVPILAREPVYQSFEQYTYYDNLDCKIGSIPMKAHAKRTTLRKSLYVLQLFHLDSKMTELFIFTSKAGSGYLNVNKNISRLYHEEMNPLQIDSLNYYINKALVSKPDDWERLIKLSEADMRLDSINFSPDRRTINAYISVKD